ncbi:hypothetical protein B0H14DRAFT_3480940 [Mycena olivaceomarginata]|nr:hypothetical protein B0H14DRAFT_3480940 [Mycena olivaceomarginata]
MSSITASDISSTSSDYSSTSDTSSIPDTSVSDAPAPVPLTSTRKNWFILCRPHSGIFTRDRDLLEIIAEKDPDDNAPEDPIYEAKTFKGIMRFITQIPGEDAAEAWKRVANEWGSIRVTDKRHIAQDFAAEACTVH